MVYPRNSYAGTTRIAGLVVITTGPPVGYHLTETRDTGESIPLGVNLSLLALNNVSKGG